MNPTNQGLNPAQQAFVNNWLKSAQSAVQQPTANLEQTQAQTGEAGAEAAAASQSAQTSAQERTNLEAQNPGIQATTQSEQIAARQKKAQLDLSDDLTKNKITLPSAIKKYTALGMSPDSVFTQYLSESPYGTPHENPQDLQQLGVTPDALGKIGTPGSFMDKYNTKNAIQEISNLQDLWNQTGTISKIPFLAASTPSGKAYQSALQIAGEHLSSLIPGASSSQGSNNALINSLPQLGDLSQLDPAAAKGQFDAVEKQLLASKGYTKEALGLAETKTPPAAPKPKGGDLLSGLMGQVLNAPENATANTVQQNAQMPSGKGNLMQSILNSAGMTANLAKNTVGNPAILGQAASIATLPDALAAGAGIPAFLAKLGGKKAVQAAATSGADNLPGALKTFINPKGAISQAGNVRDAVVAHASSIGKQVDGNDLIGDITNWAQKAKLGNLGQGKAIDTAVQDAGGILKDQKLDPKDLMKAYNEADSGFTTNRIAKTPIQANIDRGLRDILAKRLDEVAPGWKNSTTSMAKAYQVQKSPLRAGVKNIAKLGLPFAVGGGIGDVLSHVLFPGGK